jgi:hypothetical protein
MSALSLQSPAEDMQAAAAGAWTSVVERRRRLRKMVEVSVKILRRAFELAEKNA